VHLFRDQGPHGRGVGGGQGGRLDELRAAQRGQDRIGPLGDLAAAGGPEDRRYLGAGQPRGAGRVRRPGQQLQRVGASRSSNAATAAGKYSRSWARSRSTTAVRARSARMAGI
jgi:hypothetical protein